VKGGGLKPEVQARAAMSGQRSEEPRYYLAANVKMRHANVRLDMFWSRETQADMLRHACRCLYVHIQMRVCLC
jgi:hypothetical protein